jgi:uncharacterized Zn-binding protein involved in type VI secretion
MGMPACRIGDLTEHGGTIMVGFPTVLIGEMPASRIGDMHVCPMVTPGLPPIPHVGGPFVLGSPTVLVGMMPQSRVTDMLVCVGPPDQAVLGCMTVLVGMAGGAGAAGAGAGAAAMGVPVPAPAPAAAGDDAAGSTQAAQTKATRQPDGSVQTASTAPGKALPPMALKQPGWPDLPPDNTATFSSVQPATVLPGTQLYAAGDGQDPGSNSYWSTEPPSPSDGGPARDSSAGGDDGPDHDGPGAGPDDGPGDGPGAGLQAAERGASSYLSSGDAAAALGHASPALAAVTHAVVLTVTSPGGLKGWAGTAANQAPGLLVYAPPEVAQAAAQAQEFRLPPAQPRPGRL